MAKQIKLLQAQLDALQEWARVEGRSWKIKLAYAWADGNYHGSKHSGMLQQIRNQFGPTWLDQFSFKNVVVTDGLTQLQAESEAARCLECGCSSHGHYEGCRTGHAEYKRSL